MELAVNASRPEVGSSRSSTRGSVKTCTAILARLFSPPEIPLIISLPIRLLAQSFSPILSNTSSALSYFSCVLMNEGRRRPAANRRVSRTVSDGNSASSSWQTYEQTERITESEGTAPLNFNLPEDRYLVPMEFRSLSAMALRSDVLPLPDGPIMTLRVPAWKVVVTGLTIQCLGRDLPVADFLSNASANLSSPTSMALTSAMDRAVIFSFPADRSVSVVRALATVISTLRNVRPIVDSSKKKTMKEASATIGLAIQFVGKPRDFMIYAPVYCSHAGLSLPPGYGQS